MKVRTRVTYTCPSGDGDNCVFDVKLVNECNFDGNFFRINVFITFQGEMHLKLKLKQRG